MENPFKLHTEEQSSIISDQQNRSRTRTEVQSSQIEMKTKCAVTKAELKVNEYYASEALIQFLINRVIDESSKINSFGPIYTVYSHFAPDLTFIYQENKCIVMEIKLIPFMMVKEGY